jgi:capsule polysaccharide export protein KpsE/RkpR
MGEALRDFWHLLRKGARWLILVPLAVLVATYAGTFLMPEKYLATVKLLPPTLFSATLQPADLSEGGGSRIAEQFAIRNQGELYATLIQSEGMLRKLIERFKLQQVYGHDSLERTMADLAQHLQVTHARDGLITVQVLDTNAERAQAMANAVPELLEQRVGEYVMADGLKRRAFFASLLDETRRRLAAAEAEFASFQRASGVFSPGNQSAYYVNYLQDLRQKAHLREAQLVAMQSYATADNPAYRRIAAELAGLRRQIAENEKNLHDPQSGKVAQGHPPESELEYQRRAREIKVLEAQLDQLGRRYEAFALQSARNYPVVQVADAARRPERSHSPRRLLLALTAAMLALIGTLLAVVGRPLLTVR